MCLDEDRWDVLETAASYYPLQWFLDEKGFHCSFAILFHFVY